MRFTLYLCLLLFLFACNKNSGTPSTQAPANGAAPSNQVTDDKKKLPTQAEIDSRVHVGTAKTVIQADGPNTTYVEVVGTKSTFWIAVSKTDIKQGDTVKFPTGDAVVMDGFKSSALNRSFDRILFVTQIEVVK